MLLLAGWVLAVQGAPDGTTQAAEPRRNALRQAVEAHRAERRDEVRREEAAMGRHLSPAELAELREQVRQQWVSLPRRVASAESQPAERIMAASESLAQSSERRSALLVPAARSQRP